MKNLTFFIFLLFYFLILILHCRTEDSHNSPEHSVSDIVGEVGYLNLAWLL